MKKHFAYIAMIGLALVGCNRNQSREISGQVFIVRADRETVKLSLQEIAVISESEATNRIATVSNEAKLSLPDLINEQQMISNDLVKVTRDLEATKGTVKIRFETVDIILERAKIVAELERPAVLKEADQVIKELEATKNRIAQYGAAQAKLQKTLDSLDQQIAYWSSAQPYFKSPWSKIIAKTTTDADGNFRIKVPEGCYLASFGSRKVLSGEESYGWVVPVDQEKILLSNHNMLKPASE